MVTADARDQPTTNWIDDTKEKTNVKQ